MHRWGSDPMFLWPWRRRAAAAPIEPLALELPCASGMGLKKKKKERKIGEKRVAPVRRIRSSKTLSIVPITHWYPKIRALRILSTEGIRDKSK